MTQIQISKCARYVSAIRNEKKRAYAIAWFNYRRGATVEPVGDGGLSVMGAQAVRLQIDAMLLAS